MKLSVITINFNNAAGLKKTMHSVARQQYPEIEYIVIDGGSSDNSKQLIDEDAANIAYWVSEPDNGVYNAQNKGIARATGEYVIFLNSGDYFAYDAALHDLFSSSAGADIVYGDIVFKSDKEETPFQYPDTLDFDFFWRNTLPHPCTLIRRHLFTKYGLYNEEIALCADWAFFVDAICKYNATYKHVSRFTSVFMLGGLSSQTGSPQKIEHEKQTYFAASYPLFKKQHEELEQYRVKIKLLQHSRIMKIITSIFPFKIRKTLYK